MTILQDRTPSTRAARRLRAAGGVLLFTAIAGAALPSLLPAAAAQEARPGPQRQEPNRGGDVDLASQDVAIAQQRLKLADGYEVNLFASEREFPELGKAVALRFDARGRMWVLTAPTYPHYMPGVPPDDKLLILEDTNRDGRADKLTTFADGLYIPMGFELGDGGVYVSQQPNLMFLRDTNGDDKADERRIILHGFGTEDSHHSIHSFTWSPGGTLHFQEGTFLHSQVETPYGPVRVDYAAVWEYAPRTEKLRVFVTYPFANPWGHVIDRWGQNLISDASNGNNHYGTAFSGHVDYPNKQKRIKEWTTGTKMRPTANVELVSSRQFPEEAQGNFLVTNVIGFQGIKQYKVTDEGSGFVGAELPPLIQSTDPNFRPVDLQFGPDGALYVVDWFNPLIGHMQYSIRDPRRDKIRGRIWRIAAKGRPLLDPVTIEGQSIEAQLELLKTYEDRTRYRVRRALREHPTERVVAALKKWVAGLDTNDPEFEHHLTEALWIYQHHDVVEPELLSRVLKAKNFRARAAGVRVLQHWFGRVPNGFTLLQDMVKDPAPRVRLEAVRALSFVPTRAAAEAALDVLQQPTDYYIDYVLDSTMTTLEKVWKPALSTDASFGQTLGRTKPKGLGYLLGRISAAELAALPPNRAVYDALLARPDVERPQRQAALEGLAKLTGASVLQELVNAVERLDGAPGSSDTTGELMRMLIASDAAVLSSNAAPIERLATKGKNAGVRQGALVALMRADKGVTRAWQLSSADPRSRIDLLNSLALLEDPALTAALYPQIEALLKGLPAATTAAAPASASAAVTQAPVKGRYVRVTLPGREALTLYEVEVRSGGENVALKGTASQSSTVAMRAGTGEAKYAQDGKTEGEGPSGAAAITPQEWDPWWEIDLGAETPIDAVTIWGPARMGGQNNEDYRSAQHGSSGTNYKPSPVRPTAYQLTVLDGSRQPTFVTDGVVMTPPSVTVPLGGDLTTALQRAALDALSRVPGHDDTLFPLFAGYMRPAATRVAAIEALRRRPQTSWPQGQMGPLADQLVTYARDTPGPERSDAAFTQTVAFVKQVAEHLPQQDRQRITAALDSLAVKTIKIEAVASQMKFDLAKFTVEPGQEVELLFVNRDEMPHNLLITAPGKLEDVSLKAEAMVSQPDAFAKGFVPQTPDVLWATALINPRETARLRFTAPTTPDSYPFVCTFPGHWRSMNGVMQVVKAPAPSSPEARR